MQDPNDPQFQKELEQKRKQFYDAVAILREDKNFKVYLERVQDLADYVKDQAIRMKVIEDFQRLQTYYSFLEELLNFAHEEEPNIQDDDGDATE